MPPDPVLALLAFLGLLAYCLVGTIVGVLSVYFLGAKGEMGYLREHKATPGFVFALLFWPAWLAALAVFGVGAAIVALPIWTIRHSMSYIAGALEERADAT